MISDILFIGRDKPQTAKELAQYCGCNPREVTERIERERRQGIPICASCDAGNPGYYLAADADDLKQYCDNLHGRAAEIYKTRAALLKTLQKMTGQDQQEGATNEQSN